MNTHNSWRRSEIVQVETPSFLCLDSLRAATPHFVLLFFSISCLAVFFWPVFRIEPGLQSLRSSMQFLLRIQKILP